MRFAGCDSNEVSDGFGKLQRLSFVIDGGIVVIKRVEGCCQRVVLSPQTQKWQRWLAKQLTAAGYLSKACALITERPVVLDHGAASVGRKSGVIDSHGHLPCFVLVGNCIRVLTKLESDAAAQMKRSRAHPVMSVRFAISQEGIRQRQALQRTAQFPVVQRKPIGRKLCA